MAKGITFDFTHNGFNRYSYCLNNPLRYTDPSGWYCRPEPKTPRIDYTYQYLEPRDGGFGSPFMVNYFLNGVDCSGTICSGNGGGGGYYLPDGIKLVSGNYSSYRPSLVWELGTLMRSYMDDPSLFNRHELMNAGVAGYNYGFWHTAEGEGGYYMNIQFTNGNSSSFGCDNHNFGHLGYSDITIGASSFYNDNIYYNGIGINSFAGLWASTTGLIMSSLENGDFKFYEDIGQLHKADYIKKGLVPKGASRQVAGKKVAKSIGEFGKRLGVFSAVFSIAEPFITREIEASDIYYAASSSMCAVLPYCGVSGPVGWALGAGLIVSELVSYGITGQSVGDNINNWCNNWKLTF